MISWTNRLKNEQPAMIFVLDLVSIEFTESKTNEISMFNNLNGVDRDKHFYRWLLVLKNSRYR